MTEAFDAYDKQNPEVFKLFLEYSEMALNRGFKKFSAKAVFERLRWYYQIEKSDMTNFKLNNNYTAHYARKLIREYPEFEGFFELRERKKEYLSESSYVS